MPNYTEGVITPSPGCPETSASPAGALAAVTGTFHKLHTVFLGLGRTLTDLADLPPGLYTSNMDPLPTRATIAGQSNTQRTHSFMRESVHHNVSDSNNRHYKL